MRTPLGSLMLICLTIIFGDHRLAAKPPFDVRDVQEVRHWVRLQDRWRQEYQYLLYMGEKVFPTYEAILSDPKSSNAEVSAVFGILWEIEWDRRRFIKYALSRLTDEKSGLQHVVADTLRTIGSPAEASVLIALLSDEDRTVVPYAAARALADIGGPNEVVAMDVWLRGDSHRKDKDIRQYVKEHCDKLKQRLEVAKDPKMRAHMIREGWKRDLCIVPPLDGFIVQRSAWVLTAFGNETVTFLKEHVRPVPAAKQKYLDQLLTDLDSDSFDRREAATRELSRGVVVDSVLEKALANHPSLELRRRLEAILEDMPNWKTKNPELLRQVRAVWVLQQIGTPEAKALLEKIAAGAPSARLTQKAKDALQFLECPQKR